MLVKFETNSVSQIMKSGRFSTRFLPAFLDLHKLPFSSRAGPDRVLRVCALEAVWTNLHLYGGAGGGAIYDWLCVCVVIRVHVVPSRLPPSGCYFSPGLSSRKSSGGSFAISEDAPTRAKFDARVCC